MIRHLQNEADAARSLTWQRRNRRQGTSSRVGIPTAVGTPIASAYGPILTTKPSIAQVALGGLRTNAPIVVQLVERVPSGTDPLRDLAIVNVLTGMGGRPSGPKAVLLVGDLADRIADGSIRLDHGDPHPRRRTRGWEAPLFFGAMRRILIDRIRASRWATGRSPDELVCKMAQAMGVPNNDAANIRFIDAVWASPDAILGDRPTARSLTRLRAAFRQRNAVPAPRPPHTAGGNAS